jgi:hypothetical protein
MKVELQIGDTIAIPEGCKAIVKDGSVVFEREQKFKDGDILVSFVNGERYNAFIYKGTDKYGFHSYYVGVDACKLLSISESPSCRWGLSKLSYATEEEKQLLFDKMKEQGLKWNSEERKVEKIRWRAKKDGGYHFVNTDLTICSTTELGDHIDVGHYDALNYFRTKKQAKEAAKRVKEVLRKYRKEIGE